MSFLTSDEKRFLGRYNFIYFQQEDSLVEVTNVSQKATVNRGVGRFCWRWL